MNVRDPTTCHFAPPLVLILRLFQAPPGVGVIITACVSGTPGCGGNFSAASGVLISPGYPNPYPHNAACVWLVSVPADGEHITLNFTDIDLEAHRNCQWDYVEVSPHLSCITVKLHIFATIFFAIYLLMRQIS